LSDFRAFFQTHGKMVWEIRPDMDWHKGKAVEFLLHEVFGDKANDVFAVYIGDDRTDEDAFRFLAARGNGNAVSQVQYRLCLGLLSSHVGHALQDWGSMCSISKGRLQLPHPTLCTQRMRSSGCFIDSVNCRNPSVAHRSPAFKSFI